MHGAEKKSIVLMELALRHGLIAQVRRNGKARQNTAIGSKKPRSGHQITPEAATAAISGGRDGSAMRAPRSRPVRLEGDCAELSGNI
jgi:hypothetical protein